MIKSFIYSIPFIGGIIANAQSDKPNIIFIMSDDHAIKAISAYQNALNNTPNIDRIAKEGMRFNSAYVTNSISGPSRAVILTGKYSHINGMIDNKTQFNVSQQTFPKLLKKEGYQTALIGKWHLVNNPDSADFNFWKILPDQGEYYNPSFINMDNSIEKDSGYVTDLITDYAINWLENRDNKQAFCLMVHHKAPHRTFMPNLKYLDKYTNDTFLVPETFFDDYNGRIAAKEQKMSILNDMTLDYDLKMNGIKDSTTSNWTQNGWKKIRNQFTPEQLSIWDAHYNPIITEFNNRKYSSRELAIWKYNRYMQDYLATVASVDESVGRILEYLDKNGLTKNTIVIYTSDQGFYLGEHGWFDKRFMYEESFRTPLLIRYPKEIIAGSVNSDFVLNLDFASTFLDLAGIKIPTDIQGNSIRPLFDGFTPRDWRKNIYYHYYEFPGIHSVKAHYGIRTEQYKLIHFYKDIDTWELYDLKKDPQELINEINNKEYTTIKEKLIIQLKREQEKYKDNNISLQ